MPLVAPPTGFFFTTHCGAAIQIGKRCRTSPELYGVTVSFEDGWLQATAAVRQSSAIF